MALFVARPSRGSWLFFGLVTLAALSARGYGNYERSVVRRDAPVAETAQRLAGCVFGADAMWLLAPDTAAEWKPRFASWLRGQAAVAPASQGGWPGRCAPMAGALAERLQRTPGGNDARRLAEQVQTALRDGGGDRLEFIARLDSEDSDSLPQLLAELLAQVRGLSQGTREGWHPMPATFARDARMTQPDLPRLASLPPAVARPAVASGASVVFFSSADGMAHQLEVVGGAMRDTVFGPALPYGDFEPSQRFGDGVRDGVLRAESDAGGAWAVLGDAPRLFAAPAGFAIEAEPRRFAWDAAVSGAWFALATLDNGTARVQVTPRDGPTRWLAPAAVGAQEGVLAALVAPGPSPDAWVVTTLRSELTEAGAEQAALAQYDVRVEAPAPDPRRPDAPAEPARLAVSEARAIARDVTPPTFRVKVSTCAWGSTRYVALVGDRDVTVLRVRGSSVDRADAPVTWPGSRDTFTVACDGDRALVGAVPVLARGGYLAFSFAERPRRGDPAAALALEPPSMGPAATLHAVVMVRGGYLALVSNQATLRAYRYAPRAQGGRWEVGGLVALASPPGRPTRTFAQVSAGARGDAVTMLLSGTWSPRPARAAPDPNAPPHEEPPPAYPYTTVVVSGDGGRTFWSP